MARKKFKFVEMFINPDTGAPFEDTGSPKLIEPKHFKAFIGHQIARIEYEEKVITDIQYKVGKGGSVTKGEERKRTILIEKMGEKGGWLEQTSNLSQDGDCWVGTNGIVCGNGFVCDNVVLSSGEVGDNAKVGGEATISGDVGIGGNAYVYGKAKISGSGRIAVKGTARVEGKVDGNAIVDGSAYVGEGATIKGNAHVTGNAKVISGTVEGKAKLSGNAFVKCGVKSDAEIKANGSAMEGASVDGGKIEANGSLKGSSEKCIIGGGAVVVGSVTGSSEFKDGSRVGEEGSATSGEYGGSANVGGTSNAGMEGNSVVAPDASSSMSLEGNMVYLEEADTEPEGIAVVCKVEP